MPALLHLAESSSTDQALVGMLVFDLVALVLLLVILVLDLRWIAQSKKLANALGLPKGQWLRFVKTLWIDPVIEVFIVGILLAKDIVQNWEHAVAAVIGVAIGAYVGHFRYKIQYVRAVPEHKAIVFVRSKTEYVALFLLVIVRWAAEQHRIPINGPLTLIITLLLALIIAESVARSWLSYSRYKKEAAGASVEAAAI